MNFDRVAVFASKRIFQIIRTMLIAASLTTTGTARAEDAENTIEEYYAKFILSGADGIFADQPDLLAACVRDMS